MESTLNSLYAKYCDDYWQRAKASKIPSNPLLLPYTANDRFLEMFDKSLRIRTYLARNLREILKSLSPNDQQTVVALYGKKSKCMIDWWGDETLKEELRADGIDLRTTWNIDAIGPNAITVGLLENYPMKSVGKENYNKVLQKYAIYFSPASISLLIPTVAQSTYGLALFTRVRKDYNNDYLMAITSIAYGLMMTLHMNHVCQKIYRRMSQGFLGLDTRLLKDQSIPVIAFHDEAITDILGVPSKDYSFERLDTIIDPLPANEDFWKIITQGRDVQEWHLPITCRGITNNYIITLISLPQPGIGANGSYLHITTQRRASMEISKKMGSNAVLRMENIIGESPVMQETIQRARLLAQTNSNVILLGESGVGKDVFAQAIHNASSRSQGPFIAVNCGALPRELIASELFGYVGGSFTGAKKQGNIGKFELANGGTLFLDEIGELPYDLQATLLRVVEQKQLTRIGGTETINIDVKIISATNENLPAMIEQHRFRADLYFRLSTMFLAIPPLRERGDDIVLLAEYFAGRISQQLGRSYIPKISDNAKEYLRSLPWSGNVRELQNVIENAVQLYQTKVIDVEQIQQNINAYYQMDYSYSRSQPPKAPEPEFVLPRVNKITDQEILEMLNQCGGNRVLAAKHLHISRATLYRRLNKMNLPENE